MPKRMARTPRKATSHQFRASAAPLASLVAGAPAMEPLEVAQLDVDDPGYVLARQAGEDQDLVEPVEEFGAERRAHRVHHLRAYRRDVLVLGEAGEILAAEV